MDNSKYYNTLLSILADNMDITQRTLRYRDGEVTILYIKQLTDRQALSELTIKPLTENSKSAMTAAQAQNTVFADDCAIEDDGEKIEGFLLCGMTVLLFSRDTSYLVINHRQIAHRDIPAPEVEYILHGPRDCFIENLDVNLSLIRYRIKNKNLKIDFMETGKRTKTRIAVIYMEDIANQQSVDEIKRRIGAIDTDGFVEAGELKTFLLNKKSDFFPQMGIVERSDMACAGLLEGKIVTLVDGGSLGLMAPKVLGEFIWTCDDMYDNKYVGLFLRLLRVLALLLSFTLPALYVAIVSFHSDALPSEYIIALAKMRAQVPFNALVEVLIIEIIAEFLRDAVLRIPNKMTTAISVFGAIIIGQAAIAAGIFSAALLIVVSISLICSFLPADFTLNNSFRLLKFAIILASGTFGLYGFSLTLILILASLASVESFGVPYLAPAAPFNMKDFIKSFLYSKATSPKRPEYLRTKDKFRSGKGSQPVDPTRKSSK